MQTRAITILAVLAVAACEAIEPEWQIPDPAFSAHEVDAYEIRTVGTRM
jgi:hypothetical protein